MVLFSSQYSATLGEDYQEEPSPFPKSDGAERSVPSNANKHQILPIDSQHISKGRQMDEVAGVSLLRQGRDRYI